jgi:hypothetical protein
MDMSIWEGVFWCYFFLWFAIACLALVIVIKEFAYSVFNVYELEKINELERQRELLLSKGDCQSLHPYLARYVRLADESSV